MLHGKKIYESQLCGSKAHIFLFVQGTQLVSTGPMHQLTIASSPKGSLSIPPLQLGQLSCLPDLRLLSALQAHGGLLMAACEGNGLPQLG